MTDRLSHRGPSGGPDRFGGFSDEELLILWDLFTVDADGIRYEPIGGPLAGPEYALFVELEAEAGARCLELPRDNGGAG